MDSDEEYSLKKLENCSYRVLQQTAKSMSLPSNVKKIYLIQLIHAKKYRSMADVEFLVRQVRQERQQTAVVRKRANKPQPKKITVQQSTEVSSTSIKSPSIAATPKRTSHFLVRYSPEYRPSRCARTYQRAPPAHRNNSDRVLRSFNVVKRPSYIINNNTVIGVIKTSTSQGRKETKVILNTEEKYHSVRTHVARKVEHTTNELVPVTRSANISPPATKRQRTISGIYPLSPKKDMKIPNVIVRRPDGRLSKINAIIQKPVTQQHKYDVTTGVSQPNYNYDVSTGFLTQSNYNDEVGTSILKQPNKYGNSTRALTQPNYKYDVNTRALTQPNYKHDVSSSVLIQPNYNNDVGTNVRKQPNYKYGVITSVRTQPNFKYGVSTSVSAQPNYKYDASNRALTQANYKYDNSTSILTQPNVVSTNVVTQPTYRYDAGTRALTQPNYKYDVNTNVVTQPNYKYDASTRALTQPNYKYDANTSILIEPNYYNAISTNVVSQPNYNYDVSTNVTQSNYKYDASTSISQPNYNYDVSASVTESKTMPELSEITDVLQNEMEYGSQYFHKKIRAEQMRTKSREVEERLPHITDVFSKFNSLYCREVMQPIYVQVSSESEIGDNITYTPQYRADTSNTTMLEKVYNLKSVFLVHQPLLQICTTANTKCVYSTPVMTTAKPQPSIPAASEYNIVSMPHNSQYSVETDTTPRFHDFFKNFTCTEDMSLSSSSAETMQSQELGANVTIPEMVEDALELISQDGDYMERMGMDIRMQCILCQWAGPKIILEYHIRKEHSSEVVKQDRSEWCVSFSVGGLARAALWRSRVFERAAALYVLSAHYNDPDCFMATLTTLSSEEDTPKIGRITAYNRMTGEPFTWEGEIQQLPPSLPYENTTNCLKVELSRLNLLPNSANLKLINGELVMSSGHKVVIGQSTLDDIHIVLTVKLLN